MTAAQSLEIGAAGGGAFDLHDHLAGPRNRVVGQAKMELVWSLEIELPHMARALLFGPTDLLPKMARFLGICRAAAEHLPKLFANLESAVSEGFESDPSPYSLRVVSYAPQGRQRSGEHGVAGIAEHMRLARMGDQEVFREAREALKISVGVRSLEGACLLLYQHQCVGTGDRWPRRVRWVKIIWPF